MDYNFSKGGVDTWDLMCSRISTSRKTQSWPMVMFFQLLDLASINSLRIFQFNFPNIKNNTRKPYMYELSLELMNENLKECSQLTSLPRDLKLFLKPYRQQESSVQPKPLRRGICYICGPRKNNRNRIECEDCGWNVCKIHSITFTTCDDCHYREEDENSDMDVDYFGFVYFASLFVHCAHFYFITNVILFF